MVGKGQKYKLLNASFVSEIELKKTPLLLLWSLQK